MTIGKATSRQNHATKTLVLRKPLIEGDELAVNRLCKRSQVSIVPNFWRKRLVLSQCPLSRFDSHRFFDIADIRINAECIVGHSSLLQRDNIISHCLGIRCQSQKSDLGQPTETTRQWTDRMKPSDCRLMMLVPLEGKTQPDVNIKKLHLLVPEALQCVRWLNQWYQVRPNQKSAELLEQGFWQNESPDSDDTSPLRSHRLATKPRHRVPPHRFEHVLKFPYAYFLESVRRCQVSRELRGIAS